MSESASVEVLSAEVRVLQVGNGQLTRSMYRQLDEATFERFEPFGRVKDNKRKPEECWSWWAATPRPARWFATTHNRPTGRRHMGLTSSRTGWSTNPRSTKNRLPPRISGRETEGFCHSLAGKVSIASAMLRTAGT